MNTILRQINFCLTELLVFSHKIIRTISIGKKQKNMCTKADMITILPLYGGRKHSSCIDCGSSVFLWPLMSLISGGIYPSPLHPPAGRVEWSWSPVLQFSDLTLIICQGPTDALFFADKQKHHWKILVDWMLCIYQYLQQNVAFVLYS